MTRQETIALVALASSSYPSMQARDPRPIVEAWSLMLAELDPLLAKAAIIKVCRESQFFPSVAQIVSATAQLDPRETPLPTAAEAWEQVSELIQSVGPYRAPTYSCDVVKRAVRAIGWRQLCMGENPEADRAHFLRLYESMRGSERSRQENETALKLSGLAPLIQALAGKIGLERTIKQ